MRSDDSGAIQLDRVSPLDYFSGSLRLSNAKLIGRCGVSNAVRCATLALVVSAMPSAATAQFVANNSFGTSVHLLVGQTPVRASLATTTAAFYDVLPPAADKPTKPIGEWNTSRLVVRGNHVEHWLNGRQVLAYELGSPEVKEGIAKSKFKDEPGFGDKIAGHIMLTFHGDEAWIRNIRIKELK